MTVGHPHPLLVHRTTEALCLVSAKYSCRTGVRRVRVLPSCHLTGGFLQIPPRVRYLASASGSGYLGPQGVFTFQIHDMPGTQKPALANCQDGPRALAYEDLESALFPETVAQGFSGLH
jgi:hypothetical protein